MRRNALHMHLFSDRISEKAIRGSSPVSCKLSVAVHVDGRHHHGLAQLPDVEVVHGLHPGDAADPPTEVRHADAGGRGLQQQQAVPVHLGGSGRLQQPLRSKQRGRFLFCFHHSVWPDLQHGHGGQHDDSQRREGRILQQQEGAGSGAVPTLGADCQHDQAVGQSQEGAAEGLQDESQRQEMLWPLAVWTRPVWGM